MFSNNKVYFYSSRVLSNAGHGTYNYSIPFTVDDLSMSETEFDVTEVQIPPSILEKCAILPPKNQTTKD